MKILIPLELPAYSLPLLKKIEADMAFETKHLAEMTCVHWDDLLIYDPESPMNIAVENAIRRQLGVLSLYRAHCRYSYPQLQRRVRAVLTMLQLIHGKLHPQVEEASQAIYGDSSITVQLKDWNAGHPVILITPIA